MFIAGVRLWLTLLAAHRDNQLPRGAIQIGHTAAGKIQMVDLYVLCGADSSIQWSPYCWRASMALAHKDVGTRILPWRHGGKTLPGGSNQVPVLVDQGEIVGGSLAIARYLEHKYTAGPSLFSGDGGDAHIHFLAAWTDTVLIPSLLPIVAPDLPKLMQPSSVAAFTTDHQKRIGMNFTVARRDRGKLIAAASLAVAPLRHVLSFTEFLGGPEPSYADYVVFGAFQWVRCGSSAELLEPTDPIARWRETMLGLFGDHARHAKRGYV